jgi:DNA primase
MVGYQKYQPDAPRTHTNQTDTRYHSWFGEHKVGAWGVETVNWAGGPLFLTEGIFNACRLHWHGLPALAVISNDPKHLRSWFRCLPHHLIAVCDGDAAGRKLAKYGHSVIEMPAGEDVGSLSDQQFQQIFSKYMV